MTVTEFNKIADSLNKKRVFNKTWYVLRGL